MVQEVRERCGEIDVLVNNAGVIQVGPLASMNEEDFRDAMDVMFWGALWPSLAVIPAMRRRRRGLSARSAQPSPRAADPGVGAASF